MRKRQRTQHDGIDQRKNDGVRADAQCQRQNRGGGKSGRFANLPQRIAKIIQQTTHNSSPYSERKACMGSMEAARRAGITAESRPTAPKAIAMETMAQMS